MHTLRVLYDLLRHSIESSRVYRFELCGVDAPLICTNMQSFEDGGIKKSLSLHSSIVGGKPSGSTKVFCLTQFITCSLVFVG